MEPIRAQSSAPIDRQRHPFATEREHEIAPERLGEAKSQLNPVVSVARDRFEGGNPVRLARIMPLPYDHAYPVFYQGHALDRPPFRDTCQERRRALPYTGEAVPLRNAIDTPLGLLWRGEKAGSATAVLVVHLSDQGLA